MNVTWHKLPRLYTVKPLVQHTTIELTTEHVHYLKNVMRLSEGAQARLFNGEDGEWICTIQNLTKKSGTAEPQEQIRRQNKQQKSLHLYFSPIKKNRMDFLIEKAVELGVTDLHPIITKHTENRKLNTERLHAQIIEATEQSERLDIPNLHSDILLGSLLTTPVFSYPIFAAIERDDTLPLFTKPLDINTFGILIGPEGGFSSEEIQALHNCKNINGVNLGTQILRAETAALKMLSIAG